MQDSSIRMEKILSVEKSTHVTHLYSDGSKYDGEWAHGLREGRGTIVYSDGSVYEGEWKRDMREDYTQMRSTIVASHQRFIAEQAKRYSGAIEDISELVTCPILMTVMEDAVVAEDGYTYERSAIEHWVRLHRSSPMTRQPMRGVFFPNMLVKQLIDQLRTNGHLKD
eukprot:TRINITY_DN1152_c0_g1_i4.p1 TRINITY_DN1152_c0_g1~~TRINITY_DN1152_c0_g1_i4.p1  ORF type:complete len:167 (+),score=34.01 TRINITY_DN1152_c0_g1_i4:86-586(+)